MSDIHEVKLKRMSPAVMSKLRNGHRVRAELAGKGVDGCSCKMKESKIKHLMKSAGKGAKTISLDEDEKEANKSSGTGIMEGGRSIGKTLKKHHVGRKAYNTAKKVGKSKVVQDIKKEGMKQVADAAIVGLESEGVPPSISKKLVGTLEKEADKATGGKIKHLGRKLKNTAKKVAKHPITQDIVGDLGAATAMALVPEGGPASGAAGKYAAQTALKKAAGGRITSDCTNAGRTLRTCGGRQRSSSSTASRRDNSGSIDWGSSPSPPRRKSTRVRKATKLYDPTTGKGLYAAAGRSAIGAGMYAAGGSAIGAGMYAAAGGSAIGAGMYAAAGVSIGAMRDSRITNIGAGGNLLNLRNPALASQPLGANFHYATEFPPVLASEIRGTGLYA